jgi:hypothetical protein
MRQEQGLNKRTLSGTVDAAKNRKLVKRNGLAFETLESANGELVDHDSAA